MQWHYQASGPLDFEIHYHEGKAVSFPMRQAGRARADGTLNVAVSEPYCWMWKNTAPQPISVTIDLTR